MLIAQSSLQPPLLQTNGHLQTIIPGLFRRVSGVAYERQRIATPDQDFLDLDWSRVEGKDLVVLCHGLEGDASRPYVKGMVKTFNRQGLDAVALNYRGCSGEVNHQLRFYHSGDTDDLDSVINHILTNNQYRHLYLIGFSLGGNLVLKYLGEKGQAVPGSIKGAVTFSVPLHLHSSSMKLSRGFSLVYNWRFLRKLKKKVRKKAIKYPQELDLHQLRKVRSLMVFDDRYTAPIHGFENALSYYESCSSLYFVDQITVPTLIANALNDPFLSGECFPYERLKSNPSVFLETPKYGGHCGFESQGSPTRYWSEARAVAFLLSKEIN